MDFASFLIQTLNSLQYGLLLFLVASGLTLVFGIMGIINLAHGSFYMIGAYLAFVLTSATGSLVLAIVLGIPLALAFGAFLEWGLPKDLLVPFREQKQKMEAGKYYLVYIYLDEKSGRIVASSKLDKFINPHPPEYQEGQEVTLLIYQQTDIGYSAIINQAHWGLLYNSEVFQKISPGQKLSGYIAKVREDGKIDLTLHKPGYDKVEAVAENIIRRLIEEGGFIAVTDKSAPEKIYQLFGVSKKTYKMAVGALYKQKLIVLEKDGIRLSG